MSQEDKGFTLRCLCGKHTDISDLDTEQVAYEIAIQKWFCKYFARLQADYIDENHNAFMEFVEEMYEDREGGEY